MKFKLEAEKLSYSVDIDAAFVEALLSVVRGGSVAAVHDEDDDPFDLQDESDDLEEETPPEMAAAPSWESVKEEHASAYKVWYEFVLMWLVNFDQEGEQPERGERTRALAHSRKASAVVRLIRALGGMTWAVHDVVETAFAQNESARLDGLTDEERENISRLVAENITQVSSILFADLSDLLEYHNPLDGEDD